MHRRQLLKSGAACAASVLPLSWLFAPSAGAAARPLGEPQPFDFERLKAHARALAGRAYQAPAAALPAPLAVLDWDHWEAIRFRDDHSLWREDELPFQARFFHLGFTVRNPVRIYEVKDGAAQELAYDPAMFDYSRSGLDGSRLPADLGFAGFRLNFRTDWARDVAAFQGASYFRAVDSDMQYGLSARGLAVDCGMQRAEEFPVFTAYYLERPQAGGDSVTVYGLLDSPSIAGAYRFVIHAGDTLVMDIDATLYPRQTIERLGVAPLTSMFLTAENDRRVADDWRTDIHDSDGLQLWTGAGEWLWRPLNNPLGLRANFYADDNPRGFGLLQRDRNFDHYQDDGVFYDKRPGAWVEPKGNWGKGAVVLVEIQADAEVYDNIVAFWNPQQPPRPGQELQFGYKLYWCRSLPRSSGLATVHATYTGIGGVVGQKRDHFSRRFVVDFAGGGLAKLGEDAKVEAQVRAERGQLELVSARPLRPLKGWRAMFDLRPDERTDPINLRLMLVLGGKVLSETWIDQYVPPPVSERKF